LELIAVNGGWYAIYLKDIATVQIGAIFGVAPRVGGEAVGVQW